MAFRADSLVRKSFFWSHWFDALGGVLAFGCLRRERKTEQVTSEQPLYPPYLRCPSAQRHAAGGHTFFPFLGARKEALRRPPGSWPPGPPQIGRSWTVHWTTGASR